MLLIEVTVLVVLLIEVTVLVVVLVELAVLVVVLVEVAVLVVVLVEVAVLVVVLVEVAVLVVVLVEVAVLVNYSIGRISSITSSSCSICVHQCWSTGCKPDRKVTIVMDKLHGNFFMSKLNQQYKNSAITIEMSTCFPETSFHMGGEF